MDATLATFRAGERYSSEQIQAVLGVGNAGGVRLSIAPDSWPRRMVIMTSAGMSQQSSENPYHDRIEGDTLVYTGAGRKGDQTLGGVNQRIPQQRDRLFPIYGFALVGSRRDPSIGPKRWRFLGLLQYLRHYPELQVDAHLRERRVWLFELRIYSEPSQIPVDHDTPMMEHLIESARRAEPDEPADREIAAAPTPREREDDINPAVIESVRAQLLGIRPDRFEHVVRDALQRAGFERVVVTRYSQDGGIDVNAFASTLMWPIRDLLVQIQVKKWLHTVGRQEVAELRGSLQPHARGAVVTTSHFSRAAVAEGCAPGKNPIILVDGFTFASLVHSYGVAV